MLASPRMFLRPTNSRIGQLAATGIALVVLSVSTHAAVVYSNDFEANANGFSLTSRVALLNASTGSTTSMFLGRFTNDSPTLTLAGLTPGATYSVGFELYIGATMDGNEPWTLKTGSGGTLINTTFANFGGQNYSDTNFLAPPGVQFPPKTGADVGQDLASNTDDFTIYYFGKGTGNPILSFVAPATGSQTLIFAGAGMQEPADEFWALDNVIVTTPDQQVGVPESSEGLAWIALVGVMVLRRFWKPSLRAEAA